MLFCRMHQSLVAVVHTIVVNCNSAEKRSLFQLRQQLYKSQCRSVGWSVRNKFYSSVMLLVVYICCYSYCSLYYQIIWIFQLRQQLYKSQCRSVGQSVRNEFYSSVMLLVVYICCYFYCSLDYQIILQLFFAFFQL